MDNSPIIICAQISWQKRIYCELFWMNYERTHWSAWGNLCPLEASPLNRLCLGCLIFLTNLTNLILKYYYISLKRHAAVLCLSLLTKLCLAVWVRLSSATMLMFLKLIIQHFPFFIISFCIIPIDSSYASHLRENVSNENKVLKHESEILYFYYFFLIRAVSWTLLIELLGLPKLGFI